MAQLNVPLEDAQLRRLQRFADERNLPVAELIRDYLAYLLAGGDPVAPPEHEAPTAADMTALAEHGGAFDWLADEPDLYSASDGEPV